MNVTNVIKNNLYCLDKKCVCGYIGVAHNKVFMTKINADAITCRNCYNAAHSAEAVYASIHGFQLNNLDLLLRKYEDKHQ